MTTSTGLAALGAVLAAVLAALLTQLATSRRERVERVYERRRAALLDAQDAALDVSLSLAEFGRLAGREPGESEPSLQDAQLSVRRALAVLDLRLTRVEDDTVVAAVHAWRDHAELAAISPEDATSEQSRMLWNAMHQRFVDALRVA